MPKAAPKNSKSASTASSTDKQQTSGKSFYIGDSSQMSQIEAENDKLSNASSTAQTESEQGSNVSSSENASQTDKASSTDASSASSEKDGGKDKSASSGKKSALRGAFRVKTITKGTTKTGASADKSKSKKSKSDSKSKSQSARAGIQFSVGRVTRQLRAGRYASRISRTSTVYFAAVLEYLVAEVLELAGNATHDNKKKRIVPRHIKLAVGNDDELNKLLKDVTIAGVGVIPFIHSVLLPQDKKVKNAKTDKNAKIANDDSE